jgi:hypothetical protein
MITIGPVLALMLAVAGPATTRPSFVSSVPGLRITAASVLPRAPGGGFAGSCTVIAARSVEGRAVAERGWGVTAETRLGRYAIVSFAGKFTTGGSGSCFVEDGNIGLFEHGRLIAIVHGIGAAFEGTGTHTITPTFVTALGSPGRLRIWGESYYPPLADLEERPTGAAVVPLAAADRWCGGGVGVPNIYETRIEVARRRLARNGWRPVPTPASEFVERSFGSDLRMRRAGIVEVEGCSGTGYGLCTFNYRHPRGPTLRVISAGNDDPHPGIVINYEVDCGGRR